MFRKVAIVATLMAATLTGKALAGDDLKMGIVDLKACVEDSKLGKQEQKAFETVRKQLTDVMEKTEKELQDIAGKLDNPEYLDGLDPKAEENLRMKFNGLSQDLNRLQGQLYQMASQANFRLLQVVSNSVSKASEKIAKEDELDLVLNFDATFYYKEGLDITSRIVKEMDKQFDKENKDSE